MNSIFRSQKKEQSKEASPSSVAKSDPVSEPVAQTENQHVDAILFSNVSEGYVEGHSEPIKHLFLAEMLRARKVAIRRPQLVMVKRAEPERTQTERTQAERLRQQKLARVRQMKAKLILDINNDVGRVTSQKVRDAAAGH